jgi:hypothetical protein
MNTFATLLVLWAAAQDPSTGLVEAPWPAADTVPQPDPVEEALQPMLTGYEHTPTPQHWRTLPPGASARLLAMLDDPAVSTPMRLRALDGLAALDPDVALDRARVLLAPARKAMPEDVALQGGAVWVVARLVPARSLASELRGALHSPFPAVRMHAAQALMQSGHPAACASVRQVPVPAGAEGTRWSRVTAKCGGVARRKAGPR